MINTAFDKSGIKIVDDEVTGSKETSRNKGTGVHGSVENTGDSIEDVDSEGDKNDEYIKMLIRNQLEQEVSRIDSNIEFKF